MQSREFIGRAPARLDVMGGIADYSGSMVLEMPLNIYTEAKIRKRSDFLVNVLSGDLKASLDFEEVLRDRGSIVKNRSWDRFVLPEWSLYVFGCLFVLLDEQNFEFTGLEISISSEIPTGSGLSSSAALEVSVLRTLCQAFDLTPGKEALAVMAQRAENRVVGAPCGIMDQMTVHLGEQGSLLPINCQPYEILPAITIAKGINFYGMDTGVKHQVSGANYSIVRTAAFMGLEIIRKTRKIDYLCNLNSTEFNADFKRNLPKQMSGKDFLARYGPVSDPLNIVDQEQCYFIEKSTEYPILENERVRDFRDNLLHENIDKERIGELMYASHKGYVDCGLSCPEADFIVEQVASLGMENGLYGARITGGGSGGTVCICTENEQAVEIIQDRYFAAFGFRSMLKKTGKVH